MALDTGILSFGSYRFRYNPHTLTLTKKRRLHPYPLASTATVYQDMGYEPMVIEGEGTLCGEDVMAQLVSLERLLETRSSRPLSLPELAPLYCYFTALTVTGRAGPKLLTYRFTFWEDPQKTTTLQATGRFVLAERGDTLITLAARLGLSLEELLQYNPQLAGVVEIKEGVVIWQAS